MSIRGYVGGRKDELRIPKGDPIIQSEGKVLSGRLSVEEARALAVQPLKGECYGTVGEYDAVLRSHCRLDQQG